MKTKLIYYFFSISLLSSSNLWGTHNRAGEIQYKQVGQLSIEATIVTYTKSSSHPADRDSLSICWGDGICNIIARVNGSDLDGDGVPDGVELENNFKQNEYKAIHTYTDFGTYSLFMQDPNRNSNIININEGASDNVPFYIETTVFLSAQMNNAPILLQAPIDVGYLGLPFIHNPNAYDADGDSISYELITPLMDANEPIPSYQSITDINPGPNNTLEINELTGTITWDSPQKVGEYNIAIAIKTYRNGILNGVLIRDMQIIILEDENVMPSIAVDGLASNSTINVQANEVIEFQIIAQKQGVEQLSISSSSELYNLPTTPAEFTILSESDNMIEAQFKWTVGEEFVRDWPYQVVFKAFDASGLANFFTLRFKVSNTTVNTNNVAELQAISVFPNPVSDYLFLKNHDFDKKDFSIWDVNGKNLSSGKIEGKNGIQVKHLPKGKYILTIDNKFLGTFIKW